MSTWTEDMLELWNYLVAEFGDTMIYGSFTYDCIKNPLSQSFRMMPTNMDNFANTTIDILRTNAKESGLYLIDGESPPNPRPVVTVDDKRFEVISMENDDTAQPDVRLMCRLLQ